MFIQKLKPTAGEFQKILLEIIMVYNICKCVQTSENSVPCLQDVLFTQVLAVLRKIIVKGSDLSAGIYFWWHLR